MRDLADPLAATRAQRSLHARHWRERERLIRVLLESESEDLQRRGVRLDGCCQRPQIFETPEGAFKLRLQCCRDRVCPRCQRARGIELALRVSSLIMQMNSPRFITLTLKHRPESLRKNHDRLMRSFKQLKKERVFSRNVVSGIQVIEVTRNASTNQWHTHLHLIVDGNFLPQNQLSEAWKKVTGDSCVVDVRAVFDRGKVAKYVAEYVAKPQELHTWPADAICEFAAHMHGRRMIATFGNLSKKPCEVSDKENMGKDARYSGDIVNVVERAERGETRSVRARFLLAKLGIVWQTALSLQPQTEHNENSELTEEEKKEIRLALVSPDEPIQISPGQTEIDPQMSLSNSDSLSVTHERSPRRSPRDSSG